jgi:hypothetical protein
MPIHEIQTSRGLIRITDSHIFEIHVPADPQLVISFPGEEKAFRICAALEHAKEVDFDGKRIDKPVS